jgi:precorrin-6B methylase 2
MENLSIHDVKIFWAIGSFTFGSIIAFTAWLIRLEAKILAIEKDQKRKDISDEKIWTKIDSLQSGMSEIQQCLSRIEGKLEIGKFNLL